MKRKVSFLFLFIMVFSLCMGAVGAFAAEDGSYDIKSIAIPSGDKKHMKEVWGKMGTDGDYLRMEFKANTGNENNDTRLLSYEDSSNTIKFNNSNFKAATDKSRKNALGIFVEELQRSPVSEQTQQNIMNSLSATNSDVSLLLIPLVMDSTSADIYTAMKWLSPILPVVRILFGIGAIIISILLIGSSIMDLVYIGLPIAREGMDSRSEKNGKPKFVSNDAVSVVKETESSLDSTGGYKNAYLMYLKRRSLTYIILSICLLYLVVGELGGLIAWILNLGSGVV
ncbi:hypothetical protein SAMN03159341_13236 [Paenibacillus sp. 1_12]|uniref:hypothetical protein n=1 Tax=Paenibacillus sp. 1_12 TaxID=1566278 RepID=UPI0008E46B6D|nr:hypothetical protein [Paenibacillus sp. 1_12]SFM42443.1 hypothetical protein SAMN03159341_13236 [Paenibacillus sp. 1_12]